MAPDEGPDYHADDPPETDDMGYPMHSLAEWCHDIAVQHGFWPGGNRNYGEAIALIMSEAAESLDEHRAGKPAHYYAAGRHHKPEGVLVELMDVIVRTLDLAYKVAEDNHLKIDDVLIEKIRFNDSRPAKHGRNY